MPNKPINVMVKDGDSFAELSHHKFTTYIVNGAPPVQCKGNLNWCIASGEITSIQQRSAGRRELVAWKLKEQFATVPSSLATELSPDAFVYDDDKFAYVGDNAEFYEAVYERQPDVLSDVEFQVIDLDCEPVSLPAYVKVDFPASVKHYQQVHHRYPCCIPMQYVFGLVHDAVEAFVAQHDNLSISDFKSIQALHVYETILIPVEMQKPEREWFWPSMRSRKQKSKMVTRTEKRIEILHVVGSYRDKGNAIQIQELRGDNWDDLQANRDAYIQQFIDAINTAQRQVCPRCSGTGMCGIDQ